MSLLANRIRAPGLLSDSHIRLSDITWYKSRMQSKRIEAQIEKVKSQLLKIGEMRPGSLSRQYSACQKHGCKCVDPVKPQKHGTFYQLSYRIRGKRKTQLVGTQFVSAGLRMLAGYMM